MPREDGYKNLKTFGMRSEEEANEIRRKGLKAAAEARKRKKELINAPETMQEAIRAFSAKKATPQQRAALKALGFEDEECTNLNSFIVKLYTKFMSGDIRAGELFVALGGFTGEEIRRNQEEKRKGEESKARIAALEANMGKDLNVTSEDEGDGSVVIYLPEVDKEEGE